MGLIRCPSVREGTILQRARHTDDEYKALGDALLEAKRENIWPAAVAAGRFLALTGWRRGEAWQLDSKAIALRGAIPLPDAPRLRRIVRAPSLFRRG
jgi:integrase